MELAFEILNLAFKSKLLIEFLIGDRYSEHLCLAVTGAVDRSTVNEVCRTGQAAIT